MTKQEIKELVKRSQERDARAKEAMAKREQEKEIRAREAMKYLDKCIELVDKMLEKSGIKKEKKI